MDLLERQEEEDETDRVQMMTLHSAKGLEFPHVFFNGHGRRAIANTETPSKRATWKKSVA